MIANGWLLAVTAEGLTAVGPATELNVELKNPPPDPATFLRVLSDGAEPIALARASGLSHSAAAELSVALKDAGTLNDQSIPPEIGHSLRSAIIDGPADHGTHEIVWTAEEALLLPLTIDAELRDMALQAFVAGCAPFERLRAYAHLIGGSGEVDGDAPVAGMLEPRLAECAAASEMIAVIELTPGGSMWKLKPEELRLLDASAAHRLGPITRIFPAENFSAEGLPDLHFTVAEIAEAVLAQPTAAIDRRVQGSGGLEHSCLTARAEGAERFALAVQSAGELRTARFEELDDAVDPAKLFAYNPRQVRERGFDPAHHGDRLWCAAETLLGERRWIPAEFAGVGVEHPLPLTSSGVAAHTDLRLARNSALDELVERDAFMWTWIQRVSRERIGPAGVPDDVITWTRALAGQGWVTHWINLTMEFQPAVLCCLVHPERGLVVGAASRPAAADALRKATLEALVLALRFDPTSQSKVDVALARSPVDHLMFHMDPEQSALNDFLYTSQETVELREIEREETLETALSDAGVEPVVIDLTIPRARPFHVVRVATPELVPLTFGRDGEPLGLEILGRARTRHDGVLVGAAKKFGEASALELHPFA